jgi:DNA polymerase-1
MRLIQKVPTKSEDQFDLLEVEFQMNLQKKTTINITKTQDTEHSYQIIQGDLGLKLLLQNLSKQSSVCFDTETRTRCLACRVSRISFSYEKGKDFTYPFRRIRLKQKHSLKNLCLFRKRKIEKIGQNLKYDLKILSITA